MASSISNRGGYFIASAPTGDPISATVFWDPEICSDVIHMHAFPATRDAPRLRIADIRCPAYLFRTSDGRQHLLYRDRGRSLQIVIHGHDVRDNVRLMIDAVMARNRAKSQMLSLECFNNLCRTDELAARYFPTERRGPRLRRVVQALDGRLAGASHRDIAVAFFGSARVDADWPDPSGHLRDHVRRALYRGQTLMNGGYSRFLA